MDIVAVRRKIFRGCQLDGVSVFQREQALHDALAECRRSDQRSVVVILDGSCKNLGSAGAVLID